MDLTQRIPPSLVETLKADLAESGGREVLWIGQVDEDKRLIRVEQAAVGDLGSVPALVPHMERGDVVLHNHPSGHLEPSGPDLDVANHLGQLGIGFWIIDNSARRLRIVTEPLVLGRRQDLDIAALAAVLEPGGLLAARSPSYEARPAQVALLRCLTEGFNQDLVVAAEAGTGVGKSFAYLLPALVWIAQNKERVVVSTATINLQQQLIEKDIPFLTALTGSAVKAVLVKGRGNYLCPRRLDEELGETGPDDPDRAELERLKEWSAETRDGSLSDLPWSCSRGLWNRVASEADLCSAYRCGFKEACFVTRARKEAAGAGLLVVNHHLLFSDLSLRRQGFGYEATAILPPFQRLILDEAHGLEKAATSYFSESLTRSSLLRTLGRLYRRRKNRTLGLAISLQGLSTGDLDFGPLPGWVESLTGAVEALNTRTLVFLRGRGDFRLEAKVPETADDLGAEVLKPLETVGTLAAQLARFGKAVLERLNEEEKELPDVFELRSVIRRLESASALADRFARFREDPDSVYWLRGGRDFGQAQAEFLISPLNVSPFLNEAVYEPFKTVLFTSATLTSAGRFDFWAGRVGLKQVAPERLVTEVFPSPFDYARRVLLGVPADAPGPEDPRYLPRLTAFLEEALGASQGRALVLFTSYDHLSRCAEALAPVLESRGHPLYRQGDEDRARLLEKFNRNVSSVLFATDSFWEGVDSPGDTLKLVVLCKLPFRVPSDPVIAARMEDLEARGLDAFRHYSLPEAVMRFKQGFGRLMRRHSDSGAVVVYDVRLLTKSYGRVFLDSLPPTRRAFQPSGELVAHLSDFLQRDPDA